jgi:hypothetical protein
MVKNLVNCSRVLFTGAKKDIIFASSSCSNGCQNIGQPLRKMFSYSCSTSLVFKIFEVVFENLEFWTVKLV